MENNIHSKSGAAIWWAQRVSAVALIPLVIWFALFILKAIEYRDLELVSTMFGSPFVTLFCAFFVGIGLYHGNLGMIEIIEDYIHCPLLKLSLIIGIRFLSFVTAVASICAIFVLHLSSFNFN